MSRLPDNWREIAAKLEGQYSLKELQLKFSLTEGGLWYERKGNQEFEDAIMPHMHTKAKRIYAGVVNRTLEDRKAEWAEKRKDYEPRKKMPLIDKENLPIELRTAVTSIVGIHQDDIRTSLKLAEVRRWGAIMLMAQSTIEELKKELRKARTEAHEAKVRLHNRISGQQPKVHNSGRESNV